MEKCHVFIGKETLFWTLKAQQTEEKEVPGIHVIHISYHVYIYISIYLDPPKGILFKPLLEKAPIAHQERFLQVEAFLEIPWFGDLEPFISSWNM